MNAPSRTAYVLMGELFFIEEIRLSVMLPTTKPYQELLRSRMAYMLMGELFFVEDIRLSGMLPTTKPYQDLLRNRIRKREEVDIEFYGTSALI